MLIESKPVVRPIKVGRLFTPPDDRYPHYRLIPVQTETGRYHCLFFYVTAEDFLVLAPKTQRWQAVKKLSGFVETAAFPVYEITED